MTNRERMLAAYRRQQPDQVPVSPELWYDIAAQLDPDCTWQDICLGRYPLWRAQLAAHRHFGSAAWLIAAPRGGEVEDKVARTVRRTPDGEIEFHYEATCGARSLQWKVRSNAIFDNWMFEHPIKDLERDFAAFEALFFPDVRTLDLSEIDDALAGVGGDGIVTAYVGSLCFSIVAAYVEGGPPAAILAMVDRPGFFEAFRERYTARLAAIADRIAAETDAQVLLLDNGYSTAGIISPAMYEKWDLPVVRAVADAVHRRGRLLHLHQHGRCAPLLDMIVSAGADLVDPFERPPSGDTPRLRPVKERYGQRLAIRGNLHAHETLLRGTPEDVEREARECIEDASAGGGFILASGDGVIAGTPEANIFRMVEAGRKQ